MYNVQTKIRPFHIVLALVLVNLVCSAGQSPLGDASHGAFGAHERIRAAPFAAESTAATSGVPLQVSQAEFRVSFPPKTTDGRDAASGRGDTSNAVGLIGSTGAEDHVPYVSQSAPSAPHSPMQASMRVQRRGAQRPRRNPQHFSAPLGSASPSLLRPASLPSRAQPPADVRATPSESSGISDRKAPTNPHRSGPRPGAGQVRGAHGVLTGYGGQQHVLSRGKEAAARADPYDLLSAASPSRSARPLSRQHLSALTARDNAANLLPTATSARASLFGRLAESHAADPLPVGHFPLSQQTTDGKALGGSQHAGQARVTMVTHGQVVQPGLAFRKISTREYQSPPHGRMRQPQRPEAEAGADEQRSPNLFPRNNPKTGLRGANFQIGRGKNSSKGSTDIPKVRNSFLRQSDSLNPLSFTGQPSGSLSGGGRPGALTSTSLANVHHRNVTYVDLSAHTDASRIPGAQGRPTPPAPTYEAGGPVSPAQLLLQTLDARPVAPGRPPSSVIARPSPVNPEELLGSTEAPPVTLSFLRNLTDASENQEAPPKPIDPSAVQVGGAQGGQDLGPSPFFSGSPLRPQYVFTTPSPPRAPVDPASLLIAPGFTTRPPITIAPPGYNPLLDNLQKLDIVHVNAEPSPGGVDIPSPQDALSGLDAELPFQAQPPYLPNLAERPRPQEPQIPGKPPSAVSPEGPLVISNNTLVEGQGTAPILDLIDNNIAFDVLDQISGLSVGASAAPHVTVPGFQGLQSSQSPQQLLYTKRPGLQPQQFLPNNPVLNVPQPTNNGYFPQNPAYSANPYDANFQPFLSNDAQMSHSLPQQVNLPPRNPNTPVGYPNIPSAGYPNIRPDYPFPLNPHWPYGQPQPGDGLPQVPGYGVPFRDPNGHFPYPYPPPQGASDLGSQGATGQGTQPSASVAASVTNEFSSADSAAEGGDGVVSTSTTVVKGGSSTSNNNFYRPSPGVGQGTADAVPAGGARPTEVEPISRRPRPPIIVDGVHNRTATPSDIFPDSNVNVACSRRHGCPAFILRKRPSEPLPGDDGKLTYIFDEAPPLATTIGEGQLLEAIGLVLDLLNRTEGLDFEDDATGLTGDFDYIFQGAGVEGFDDLLSHTPGLAPPINPQNIRPGLQIRPVAVPSTTPSPLAQHIGLQKRPNYEVVRVPENTVLNAPSLPNLLDNKRVFSVNPILTKSPEDASDPGSGLLGQPGSFELLRNKLVQAHLETLQEDGHGVTSPDPLGSHVSEVGSLADTQMGGALPAARPSLAEILNLEQQSIPDEPPLVPAREPEGDHHHSMMRHVMAATFMGLPMTTALMTALGAPVALLAPLGLAIPALLTMGCKLTEHGKGRPGGASKDSRLRTAPSLCEQHYATSASLHFSWLFPGLGGGDEATSTTQAPAHSDTRVSHGGGGEGLRDGGGFAGALRRLGGVFPMMASRIASRMGGRRRRAAEEELSRGVPAAEAGQSESDPASASLSAHDLDTLRDLSLFYSSLSGNNATDVEKPSPDEVLMHRKYLLGLLKQLRGQKQEVLPSQSARLPPSTAGENSTFVPAKGEREEAAATPAEGPGSESLGSHSISGGVDRIGQVADAADIQNLDPSAAALLLHQFQTQGSLNLLPPGLLGQAPPTTPPPTHFDLLYGQQQPEQQEASVEGHLVGAAAAPSLERSPPRGEAKRLASGAEGPSPHHLTPASAITSSAQPSQSANQSPLPPPASDSPEGLPEILPVPQYINRSPSLQAEALPHPSLAVNAFGHPFFDTSQLPLGTDLDLSANGEQGSFLFPSSELLPMSPSELIHDRVSQADADGFAKPEFYPNYETLAEALQLLQRLNALQASPTLNRVDLGASTYLDQDPSILPAPGSSNLDYLYDQDYLQYAALSNPVPNTRLTTEVNDAFSTLAQNLADAISTFLTDIGTPSPRSRHCSSSASSFASSALSSLQLSVEALETLTWTILLQIENFEKRNQLPTAG
ncbi:hypothetical protein C7M84_000945 [Penaeus vannamei]|uniref:Uncharacterized protein n=1 Tax=Penaeus vannamei TaxID=6689 RepID=A0A3R7MLV4_PENVA|nr:hypothetical protein C7M84_000945 [Penaeus vannamei]